MDLQDLSRLLTRLGVDRDAVARAGALLAGEAPSPHRAALDRRDARLRTHLRRMAAVLRRLTRDEHHILERINEESFVPAAGTAAWLVDGFVREIRVEICSGKGRLGDLVACLGRLVEDAPALARDTVQLEHGFEDLRSARWQARIALGLAGRLPGDSDDPTGVVSGNGSPVLLMEDPAAAAAALERQLGRPLEQDELGWLELERRVAMLELARSRLGKLDRERRHIRWFLRGHDEHGVVLDRHGVTGHWLVLGPGLDPARLASIGVAVEREAGGSAPGTGGPVPEPGWSVVMVGCQEDPGAAPQMSSPAAAVSEALASRAWSLPRQADADPWPADHLLVRARARAHLEAVTGPGLGQAGHAALSALRAPARVENAASEGRGPGWRIVLEPGTVGVCVEARRGAGQPEQEVLIDAAADDQALLDALERLDRLADLGPCEVAGPDQGGPDQGGPDQGGPDQGGPDQGAQNESLGWAEAVLRARAATSSRPRVALLAVPAPLEHPLGGFPIVGTWFVADHLERLGIRADRLVVPGKDLERRQPELLGADAVGVGVWIHSFDLGSCPDEHVQRIVGLLRDHGYGGRVVLGGPHLRWIDEIQAGVRGWDGLIRGEAEQILPEVLSCLELLDRGKTEAAVERALMLSGCVLAQGDAVLLCDTELTNRVASADLRCPTPFQWTRMVGATGPGETPVLHMSFTRGCHHRCAFCPSHQGLGQRSAQVDEWWRFLVLAVADALRLPARLEQELAVMIQEHLGIGGRPRLDVALGLLGRFGALSGLLGRMASRITEALGLDELEDPRWIEEELGLSLARPDVLLDPEGSALLSPWLVRHAWLELKVAALAELLRRRPGESAGRDVPRLCVVATADDDPADPAFAWIRSFAIETSEDNTPACTTGLRELLERRLRHGLDQIVTFNPGQSSVAELGDPDLVGLLARRNRFRIVLGTDGTSGPALRHSRKPSYSVGDALWVNRELGRHGIEVESNYILLTPEMTLLEAAESMLLFVLLPVVWRDHGDWINLRTCRELGTLTCDEGLLFANRLPDSWLGRLDRASRRHLARIRKGPAYYEPMRRPAVEALIRRTPLGSRVSSRDLPGVLLDILKRDPGIRRLLPSVVARWELCLDADAELAALAAMIRGQQARLGSFEQALWAVVRTARPTLLRQGRTLATFTEALEARLLEASILEASILEASILEASLLEASLLEP